VQFLFFKISSGSSNKLQAKILEQVLSSVSMCISIVRYSMQLHLHQVTGLHRIGNMLLESR
jgi:hypothetical protein